MKVALIQCPAWITYAPPYGLAVIAACLKKSGHQIQCFDINILLFNQLTTESKNSHITSTWATDKIDDFWYNENNVHSIISKFNDFTNLMLNNILHFNPDVICFSVQYTSAFFSHELSKKIKSIHANIPIIWGGPFCFSSFGKWNELIVNMPEVDVICTGDGEKDIGNIISEYEKTGEFIETSGYYIRSKTNTANTLYIGNAISNINEIPYANIDCFNKHLYSWEYFPVVISKGCINRCAFCNEYLAYNKYQFREPKLVLEEIVFQQNLYPEIKTIWLTCSNIIGNIPKLKDFCNTIIINKLAIPWVSQLSINKNLTPELFALLKKSGCEQLIYGLESASNHVLKLMNKGYTKKLAKNVLQNTAKAQIKFSFNTVVGFPGESIWNFIETLFFIKRFLIYYITPSIATCKTLENSRIRMHYSEYNIISHKNNDWQTNDGKNTLALRDLRSKITQQLYNSRVLNLNFFPSKLLYHSYYLANKKEQSISIKTTSSIIKLASYSVHIISYIWFFFWIIGIWIKLFIAQTKSIVLHRKKQSLNPEIIKKKLVAALIKYYNQDYKEFDTKHEIISDKISKFIEIFDQEIRKENPHEFLYKINNISIDVLVNYLESNSQEDFKKT
jgi:radical SAM superfamily enzyme YgiQ (UPF0313 family)